MLRFVFLFHSLQTLCGLYVQQQGQRGKGLEAGPLKTAGAAEKTPYRRQKM